ncbi:MAG: TetR/AcrR family transcriptional regulator [Mycobacteriaceae bacterium]|nr:TetR/AcrR family transcriptional regulator [Mycobacteriaceae bacterium]
MAKRRGWGGNPPVDDADASRRVVAAAVALIAETGAPIGIADVAESLGVIRQTVYRYFPSSDALMTAAALASVDGFLDRLTGHVHGLRDPAQALVEGVVYTLGEVRRTPHLGLILSDSAANTGALTSEQSKAFGMTMIRRFDVDWERHGYEEQSLQELVEHLLRTMQSFFLSPGDRTDEELRRYLHRWLAPAVNAQHLQNDADVR